jgi:hypothetical protein
MSIDEYLRELECLLPRLERRRFLAEARTHLRQRAHELAASGVDPVEADLRAVEDFGPAELVAPRVAAERAPWAIRWACAVAFVGVVGLVVPLYAVPENVLPPAPWGERLSHLGVLVDLGLGSWLAAVAIALGALVLAAVGWVRAAVPTLVAAVAAGSLAGAMALATAVAWRFSAPTTPVATLVVLVTVAMVPALLLAVGAAAYARGARTRLLYAFETSR